MKHQDKGLVLWTVAGSLALHLGALYWAPPAETKKELAASVDFSLASWEFAEAQAAPPAQDPVEEDPADEELVEEEVEEPPLPEPQLPPPAPAEEPAEEAPQTVPEDLPVEPQTEPQEPPSEPDAAQAEEPAAGQETEAASEPELTGTTLTGDEGASFSAHAGSGRVRTGPVLSGGGRATQGGGGRQEAQKKKSAEGPEVVPISKLKKKPVPPSLADALRRNYPEAARQRGLSGVAKVRARIEPSGEIRLTRVVAESESGFGSACARTLKSSRWTAPVGPHGKKVATWISYQCKFKVEH